MNVGLPRCLRCGSPMSLIYHRPDSARRDRCGCLDFFEHPWAKKSAARAHYLLYCPRNGQRDACRTLLGQERPHTHIHGSYGISPLPPGNPALSPSPARR